MLKFNQKLNFLLIILSFSGCATFRMGQGFDAVIKKTVVHPQGLSKGGDVLILPFSAGTAVRATEDLDRIALILVRGVEDGMHECSGFEFVRDPAKAAEADLIIQGRIERFDVVDRWMRYFGGRRKRLISIEGELSDGDGVTLGFFKLKNIKNYQDMSETSFLLATGKAIGNSLCPENKGDMK
ncbi:MAG: hypothetical protein AB1650_02815 [Candidatus Omnitrophota bacterium]